MESTMLAPGWLEQLDEFVCSLGQVFPRADQRQRFQQYLHGLLMAERKNAEGIATLFAGEEAASAVSQSLQHFVSQSPWNSDDLLSRCRRLLAGRLAEPDRVWVVHDVDFPKKARRSVGVMRQLARGRGAKINCQVAVAVSQVGRGGFYPLAIRLYLPASWLERCRDDAERTVPEEHRVYRSRSDIALELLRNLWAECGHAELMAIDEGYGSSTLSEAMRQRGIGVLPREIEPPGQTDALSSFAEVIADRRVRHLYSAPMAIVDRADVNGFAAQLQRTCVREALRRFEQLKETLGMDQYEGRFWHGWHHHVSLAIAAYAFLQISADSSQGRSVAKT